MTHLDTLAQLLWSADDDATEPSWGFVNMKRRGKYLNMAKAAQEALQAPKITIVEQYPEARYGGEDLIHGES